VEDEEARYVRLLREVYGIQLAHEGLLDPADAVISVVRPQSPAAKARIEVGDVLASVGDATILNRGAVYNYLLESPTWGKPLSVTVRRGLPSPRPPGSLPAPRRPGLPCPARGWSTRPTR